MVLFPREINSIGLYLTRVLLAAGRMGADRESNAYEASRGHVMSENQIAYVELPARDVPALKRFYGQIFGWTFQDYGEDYAAFGRAGLDGGFNGDPSHQTRTPLVILETKEIEAMETKVRDAGGSISSPIFSYPGGRRFHFIDPDGNELAVMQVED